MEVQYTTSIHTLEQKFDIEIHKLEFFDRYQNVWLSCLLLTKYADIYQKSSTWLGFAVNITYVFTVTSVYAVMKLVKAFILTFHRIRKKSN